MALDYTLTFGGLTIGNGTPFGIMAATGLEDLPPLRTGDLSIGQRDGETPGLDLAAGRDIAIDIVVFDSTGTTNYFTNIERLKAATVTGVEQSLVYQLPGRNPRALMARCRARNIPVSQNYQFHYGDTHLLFHATDPRIYDQAFTSSGSIGVPTATSGLTFNATPNFVFGTGGVGGSFVAVNSGNYPAPWVAQIAGPVVNPTITLAASGQAVYFNGSVAAGDTLTIDSSVRSVLLNGTASRYSLVVSPTQWFTLPVGSSTIQFGAASGTGTLTFSYRSTWL